MGCGNILAGDDGVGVRVAEDLAGMELPAGVTVIPAGLPGHSLAELLLDYHAVIIVDAMLGLYPGNVRVLHREELQPVYSPAWHAHGTGLRESLAWAENFAAGRFPSFIKIVAIEISPPVAWSEGMTPAVEASVPVAVKTVIGELKALLVKYGDAECGGVSFEDFG